MYVMAISILNLAVTSEGTVPLAIRARADAMRAAGRGQRTRRLHGHHSPVTCGARKGSDIGPCREGLVVRSLLPLEIREIRASTRQPMAAAGSWPRQQALSA